MSEEDLEVLAFLHDAGITASVLLSKADLLSTDDLERVRGYVADQIRKRVGSDVPVRPVSSMPTHEWMLREWLRDEVTALGARAGR